MPGDLTVWYEQWIWDWDDVKQAAWVAAHAAFEAATFGPGQLYDLVSGYLTNLSNVSKSLARMEELIRQPNVPTVYCTQHAALDRIYKDLAAPILVDSQPAPSVGNPVFVPVLVVAGLAIGAWAAAYAVAHVADAAALWRQCSAFESDATARYKLAADGKPVPAGGPAPWEAPPEPPGGPDDGMFGKVIGGLGALVALSVVANLVSGRAR